MRLFGWICDPYVHVIVVAAGIVALAARPDQGEPRRSQATLVRCYACQEPHDPERDCPVDPPAEGR